jgi:hypothetical protein
MKKTILLTLLLFSIFLIAACSHSMDHDMHDASDGHHDQGSNMHTMVKLDASAELKTIPSSIVTGEVSTLAFHLKDDLGNPLQNMMVHHGRLMHTLIISEDLDMVAHIHPEDFGDITKEMKAAAQYPVFFTFPREGKYLTAIDVMNNKGTYSKKFIYNVGDGNEMGTINMDLGREKFFIPVQEEDEDKYTKAMYSSKLQVDSATKDAYKVTLNVPEKVTAGEDVTLEYNFEQNNAPVKDFEIYLDAPMHFAIVKSDLDTFMHTHGGPKGQSDQDALDAKVLELFGPDLEVTTKFPKPGIYTIFGQVKHHGKIITTNFMVEVIK